MRGGCKVGQIIKSRHKTDLARVPQSGKLVKQILIAHLDKTIRIYWSQTPSLYAKHACTTHDTIASSGEKKQTRRPV